MALLAGAAIALAPAALQAAAPEFPASNSSDDILKWLAAATTVKPGAILAVTPTLVAALDKVQPAGEGAVLAVVREELVDQSFAARANGRSLTTNVEFDCIGHRFRFMGETTYPRPNLQGSPHYTEQSAAWAPVKEGAIIGRIFTVACAKLPAAPAAKPAPVMAVAANTSPAPAAPAPAPTAKPADVAPVAKAPAAPPPAPPPAQLAKAAPAAPPPAPAPPPKPAPATAMAANTAPSLRPAAAPSAPPVTPVAMKTAPAPTPPPPAPAAKPAPVMAMAANSIRAAPPSAPAAPVTPPTAKATPTPAATTKASATPAPATAKSGPYLILAGAFSVPANAQAEAETLGSSRPVHVLPVSVGAKHLYLVEVTGFADHAEASNFCAAHAKHSADCIIKLGKGG